MKKKFIAILMSSFMVLGMLVGCSSDKSNSGGASEDKNGGEVSEVVQSAIDRTEQRTASQTEWDGPTNGPKAAEGKEIVCVNANSENAVEAMWGESVEEACKRIGWECTVLDGKGTTQGQTTALNQAISMGVDGIVTSADVEPLQATILEAKEMGIPTVGIHGSNVNGPDDELNMIYNVTSSGTEIGYALADYVIADSNGEGRVVILYDAQYAIARENAEAMKERIEESDGMELLDYVNSPLSEISTNMPTLTSSWVSNFEKPFYVITIADSYYDFVTPTLRNGGVNPEDVILVGSDGTSAAYDRIRNGDYQVGTIPEPANLLGYIAVDELNRYFNEEDVVVYEPSIFIVTKDNIEEEGGDQDMYIPSNNYADEYAKIWGVD